jgi:hypothetical protein
MVHFFFAEVDENIIYGEIQDRKFFGSEIVNLKG